MMIPKWLNNDSTLVEIKELVEHMETKMQLNVKVKKVLPNAVLPIFGTAGAAGADLTAASESLKSELTGPVAEYDTGLSFEIPSGHVGLVFPRSSVTTKTTLMLGNGVGVIDSDYRGTIKFQYRNVNPVLGKRFKVGDRIGQIIIMPIPAVTFVEATDLSDTERGTGGFGSSGA